MPTADNPQQNVQFQGMKFTPQVHGKFNFANIASFLADFLKQFDAAIEDMKKKKAEEAKGPLPELSAANFDDVCIKKGGLCAVALLDGAPAVREETEKKIVMLEKLRRLKAGGPTTFMWVDAGCHPEWMSTFEVGETDLPTMVIFSASKKVYAKPIGSFDVETLSVFAGKVAAGKASTLPFSEVPTMQEKDCATVSRGPEDLPEETPLDGEDDILAEILAEEQKQKEEMEAEKKKAEAEA